MELQEKISLLEQKLVSAGGDKSYEQGGSEEYTNDLKKKMKFQVIC